MDGTLKVKRPHLPHADQLIADPAADLRRLHVWISQVEPDLAADGLNRERLWQEVHQRLLRAGLSAPGHQHWQKAPGFPCLGVLVHADLAQVTPPFYVFSIEVFFVQQFTLRGTRTANSMRMVWCREAIGDVRRSRGGYDWSNLYSTVGTLIDQFLAEHLGLNPAESGKKPHLQ